MPMRVAGNTMTIDLPLHEQVANFTAPLNFGLGLDGLPIKVENSGTIKANIELTAPDVKFSFTVGGATSFDPGTFTTHASVGLGAGSTIENLPPTIEHVEVFVRRLFLDHDRDIVEQRREPLGQLAEGLLDELLEFAAGDADHITSPE